MSSFPKAIRRSKLSSRTLALFLTFIAICNVSAESTEDRAWRQARSTTGSFNVQLPCKPTDSMAKYKNGAALRSETLTCSVDGVEFNAHRVRYLQPEESEESFEYLVGTEPRKNEKIERGIYKRLPAATRRIEDATVCAITRVVLMSESNYILKVQSSPQTCGNMQALAARFIDSLAFEDSEQSVVSTVSQLPECPLDLELVKKSTTDAFHALPRDAENTTRQPETFEPGHCQPAVLSSMIQRREGICRIGDSVVTLAGMNTYEKTGDIVAMTYLIPYQQGAHTALKSRLISRYQVQSPSDIGAKRDGNANDTVNVQQASGTRIVLGTMSNKSNVITMSSVQHRASERTQQGNRSTHVCN